MSSELRSSLLFSSSSANPVPQQDLNRQSSKKLPDKPVHYSEFWSPSMSWDRRKHQALTILFDSKFPENQEIHRLSYEGNYLSLSNLKVSKEVLLKPNSFDLTPVIYAIWGEEDRGSFDYSTSSWLLESFESMMNEDLKLKFGFRDQISLFINFNSISNNEINFQTKDKMRESLEWLKNEYGHIIVKSSGFCFESHEIAAWNYFNSLSYLIESNNFQVSLKSHKGLSLELEEYSQVFLAVKFKSLNCSEQLFAFLSKAVKDAETSKQVLQIIEQEIEFYLTTASTSFRDFLDSLMQETTKQLVEDPDDLPKCAMIEDNSKVFNHFLNNPAEDDYVSSKIWSSVIKLPNIIGSSRSLNFLKNLEEAQNLSLYKSPLVKFYVKYKWDQLWSVIFLQDVLLLSNLPLLVVLMFLVKDGNFDFAFWSFIGVNFALAGLETLQIFALGPFEFFGGLDKRHTLIVLRVAFAGFLAFAACLGVLDGVPVFNYKLVQLIFYTYLNSFFWVFGKLSKENNEKKGGDGLLSSIIFTFLFNFIISAQFVFGWHDNYIVAIVTGLLGFIFSFVFTLVSHDSINLGLIWTCELSVIALCQQNYLFSYSILFVLFSSGILLLYLLAYCNELIFVFLVDIKLNTYQSKDEHILYLKSSILKIILLEVLTISTYSLNFFLDAYLLITSLTVALSLLTYLSYYLLFRMQSLKRNSEYFIYSMGYSLLVLNPSNSTLQLVLFAIVNTILVISSFHTQDIYLKKLLKTLKTFVLSWNTVDLARLLLCYFWVFSVFSNSESKDLSFALTVVTLARGLTSFRSFSGTRYYVRLIFNSFYDISSFIVIFMYSTISFGIISGIYRNDFQVQDIWISSYYVNLGDFSNQQNKIDLTYLSFVAATIVNVIIMLNLLISILGDSFDKFQLSAQQIDCMEMTSALVEVESMMFFRRNRQDTGMFLVVCDIAPKMKKEWEGKIIVIRNEIEEIQNRVREGLEMVVNEIQRGSVVSKDIVDLVDLKMKEHSQALIAEIKQSLGK